MNCKIKRIAVLHSRLSGYMAACLKALKTYFDVELLVFYWQPVKDAPFEDKQFAWIDHLYSKNKCEDNEICELIADFQPQAIYIAGWSDKVYLKVAQTLKKKGIPVIAGLDNQWQGSWKQRFGGIVAPFYLHLSIDVLWVAGERQAQFARKLGYSGTKCWHGLYSCDWNRFASISSQQEEKKEVDNAFLFAGRYVPDKGIKELVEAYQAYYRQVKEPWKLYCVGAGKLKYLLEGQQGIVDLGFVQPDELPSIMHQASAFVLPSREEHWGVVIHEAAASGLPLVCSDECGAAVHLLQDRYNGFLFETGNANHLTRCLVQMGEASRATRVEMGQRSYELSKQFTPQRWAFTFVEGIASMLSS